MAVMFRGLDSESYDRQYDDKYLIKRIWMYFSQHSRRFYGIVIGVILVAIQNGLRPVIIAAGIDSLEGASDFPVEFLVVLLGVSVLLEYGGNWMRRLLMSKLIGSVVSEMRKDAFNAAVNLEMAFYDKHTTGKVVSRITSDTQEFGQVIMLTSDVLNQVFAIFILLIVLFSREWRLTLILLASAPIIGGLALTFRKWARITTRDGARAMALVNDNIQESVSGISVAKNFRQEALIYSEFVEVNQKSFRVNMRRGLVLSLIFPTLSSMGGIATGIILYIGALAVTNGVINVGSWFLFAQSVDRFWFPFTAMAAFWSQFQQGLSAVERVFALIDAENDLKQRDSRPVQKLDGLIEFINVTFAYKPGENVLSNFNLTIQPGEDVAFVGHTGAGKSSIAKLITRFYEFQGGYLLIDGRDVRAFDLRQYRKRLGIVPQAPFLFSGTVMDNIRYGRPEASDAEIEEVAHSIGNGEWLCTLPEGLNSDVGERGSRLSMGQRQLVSLLRVLVQKPDIFILDEATASIDPFTETQIQEALDLILSQSTSILIAHRLSTVRSADRIIVLRDGAIIEEGSHESLMTQGGHYAELYNTYFRHQSLSYIENARSLLVEEGAAD
ncbi:MAG: ABC transporter ATP-binding protein [Chloroflexi bacterium]|nr:MAG: ABC transporter ATP-binding protein [Phototrophicales bacterium]RMF81819.1 MAG: ABC transporter ATP-binding protein [Chloroflexota bacterium]